jgi:tetratricopeptide (TPR) repeat protein
MKRAVVLLFVLACSGSKPDAASPSAPPSAQSSKQPSENEQLYTKGMQLEKEGRWEEAANAYQKYVFAMGDALTHTDRSSMEVRIIALRKKVKVAFPFEPPRAGPCSKPYDEGRYEDAASCWRDEYTKTRDPLILLYASRTYELMADVPSALALVERFLAAADAGDEQRTIEARRNVLRERVTSRPAESPRR